jgi:YVTN family beta-propeller protein
MDTDRRGFMASAAGAAALACWPTARAQEPAVPRGIESRDRVFITAEDSNTLVVIDPSTNQVETTVNLTSFDEDPRPPFQYATAGVAPTHAAMIHKPLYHGCIDAHGAAPNPDGTLLATSGRGSSNVYLIDVSQRQVVGNAPGAGAGDTGKGERLSTGILLGREPHEPTFTRNGKELWVALRGESRIAVVDVAQAIRSLKGEAVFPVRAYLPTLDGPSQVWFNRTGTLAFVASQKVPWVHVLRVNVGPDGHSKAERFALLDIRAQDRFGFTPFLKTTADGTEVWFSHKLADAVSCRGTTGAFDLRDHLPLGPGARPNHVEFVRNTRGSVTYVSQARIDDNGPGGVASSQIAIIDRSASPGQRQRVGSFFSHGREAHGLWTNPENTVLYVTHEQDELPGTPHAGQTVCSAFDVSDPLRPGFLAQIPLGGLSLPSGVLRNKKGINLVYVRPGFMGQAS